MNRAENIDVLLPARIMLSGERDRRPEAAPARPAVYVLIDAGKRPILLASTADLRHALRRRLSPDSQTAGGAPRIDYRSITQQVRYRSVGSAFAANWWYYRCARSWFPDHYRSMLGWNGAWFIRVAPDETFPRFECSARLGGVEICLGPLPSRSSARTLIHALEDIFDLCRYYEILRQSPQARACPYKDMGKCPAPCDGSITMAAYRERIRGAVEFLSTHFGGGDSKGSSSPWRRDIEQAMRGAAGRMDFRFAARLKDKLRKLHELEDPAFAHLRRLDQWAYVAFERGRTANWVEPFLVKPNRIEPWPEVAVKDVESACARWVVRLGRRAAADGAAGWSGPTEEVVSLLAYHLFRRGEAGLYVPAGDIADSATLAARLGGWLKKKEASAVVEMSSHDVAAANLSS